MSFGKNLQFLRKMHNAMTQEELADKMGVSRQTVSKWEMDGSFPEMEKAILLSKLFNCTLDELLREDLDSGNEAYLNIRIEKVDELSYIGYAVISTCPEDDAKNHILGVARDMALDNPVIIGWDFPFVSQEQINVYHMHGYCAACLLTKEDSQKCKDVITQPSAKYAVITIKDPLSNPFVLIPNAYKTLLRYMETNSIPCALKKDVLECFEKEYEMDGISYMDVYIAVK